MHDKTLGMGIGPQRGFFLLYRREDPLKTAWVRIPPIGWHYARYASEGLRPPKVPLRVAGMRRPVPHEIPRHHFE